MASVKSTLWAILIIGTLAVLAGGATYGARLWQQRALRQDLDLAQSYLAQGKTAEAETLLAGRMDQLPPRTALTDRALAMRFQALTAIKDPKASQALADRVLDPKKPLSKPGQPAWARAHLILAQHALDADQADAAQSHLKPLLALPDGSPGKDEAMVGQARIQAAAGQVKEARDTLTALLDRLPADSPARPSAEFTLGLCNTHILYSLEPMEGDQIYQLQKGDTFDRLKRTFKISPEVLMKVNNIPDPRRLTIGRRIKIPNLEFSILVNKSDNTLTLFNHGKFFKKYRVRTGAEDYMTPKGDYRINNKVVNPTWRNPRTGESFAGGAPGNELGSRWMMFSGSLGIHEAVDPATIGKYASSGCVGLKREDVEELYDLVPLGTPVKITGDRVKTSS